VETDSVGVGAALTAGSTGIGDAHPESIPTASARATTDVAFFHPARVGMGDRMTTG
jgi:hypothetical protein